MGGCTVSFVTPRKSVSFKTLLMGLIGLGAHAMVMGLYTASISFWVNVN